VVTKKRMEVSWLREDESVMCQCGKFDFNVLLDREPMKILKDGR